VFAGVYGRKQLGAAFVDFALLGGHTGNNTTRNINNNLVANGQESATASFGGWFFSPEVAAGYRYDLAPGWSLTPAARLRYLVASYDGFTESGSTANMTAAGRTLQNAEERGDVTLTRTLLSDAGRLQLGLTAGVLGQQRTGSGTVNAVLLGQALAFATPGKSNIAGAYAATSLDWRMKSGIALFAAAEYTAMSDSSSTVTGRAGVRVGF
jgi:outer membrane autotransporter protein